MQLNENTHLTSQAGLKAWQYNEIPTIVALSLSTLETEQQIHNQNSI
jgi:hypothetical protein